MRMNCLISAWILTAMLGLTVSAPVAAEETEGSAQTEGHGGHETEGFNFFDFSSKTSQPLAALFLNFIILLIIVYMLLRKPWGKKFKDRKEALESALMEARKTTAIAEEAIQSARAKMASVDRDIARMREEILDAAKSDSRRIVDEAGQRSKRLLEDTHALVANELERIATAIKEEAVVKIVETAERVVREKISASDHERIASEYLKQIAEDPSKSQGMTK